MPERTRHRTTARQTLVSAAIDHLALRGPAGVQPQDICRELGISKALVNYHFGTREGLIAEAMVEAYEQHVDESRAASTADGDDAVARLFAWIDHRIEWTTTHSGLAAALDFPDAALGRSTMEAHLADRLAVARLQSLEHLTGLVRAARAQLLGRDGSDGDDADNADDDAFTAVVIGWLTVGASVSMGGGHHPTGQTQGDLPLALQHMRTLITELLSRR